MMGCHWWCIFLHMMPSLGISFYLFQLSTRTNVLSFSRCCQVYIVYMYGLKTMIYMYGLKTMIYNIASTAVLRTEKFMIQPWYCRTNVLRTEKFMIQPQYCRTNVLRTVKFMIQPYYCRTNVLRTVKFMIQPPQYCYTYISIAYRLYLHIGSKLLLTLVLLILLYHLAIYSRGFHIVNT